MPTKTDKPQVGDRFRISTPSMFASGVVRKVNRASFTYTARYFADTYELRLPLSAWADAEVIFHPSILVTTNSQPNNALS